MMLVGPGRRGLRAAALFCILAVAAPALASEPPAPPSPAPTPSPRPPRGAGDQRRTVRSYPQNLWYNFLGIATRGNWVPLAATAAITAPSFALDDNTIDYFRRHPHQNFGKIGRTMGGGLIVGGLTVGLFSAGRIARGDRFRAVTYDLSQAIIVNFVDVTAIKTAVRRKRPNGSNRGSFPSGHASNAFASATVVARHYGWKGAVPAYGVATFIAVSRLAANEHHLSDIVAGAGFGFGIGRAVVRRNSRPPQPPPKASVALVPRRGGWGLTVTF